MGGTGKREKNVGRTCERKVGFGRRAGIREDRAGIRGDSPFSVPGIYKPMDRRLLDEDEIYAALAGVEWEREGKELIKTVTLDDFQTALAWVNKVGELAEKRDHHPDIWISWNKVTLRVSTHSSGGLTELDFDLARAVDGIAS